MTISKIFIVAKKEMMGIIKSKSQMLVGLFFAMWFSVMSAPVVKTVDEAAVFDTFNNLMFYFVLMLGIFMAYIFSGKVFFNEKREGIIETLLCTPLSLRQLWSGKVIGVTICCLFYRPTGGCASAGTHKLPDQISEQGVDRYDDSVKGREKDEKICE